MSQDKILIRSKIIEIIYNLKKTESFSEKNLFRCAYDLKKLNNNELVISTLIKEINFQNPNFDVALIFVAKILSQETTINECQKLLEKPNISDKKKLFLMNVMRELGANIGYEETVQYLNEPENLQEAENELMARFSGINPEAQIDFLDFFFGISDENKLLLLNSLSEENTGEELIRALEPIVYYDEGANYIKKIIEILKNTKCQGSKLLLDYISNSKSEFSNLAKSAKNELILSGLRDETTSEEILKEHLKNTIPLGFWGSLVDGADNFSIIFARQKGDKTIATFFNVINLKTGIVSTFGFDDITINEFKKILKRFFKASFIIKLENNVGAKILADFEKQTKKANRKIPYEYLAWRSYLADIKIEEFDLVKKFESELEKIKLTDELYENLFADNVLNSWFLTIENRSNLKTLIEKITKKEKIKIEEIEKLVKENSDDIIDDEILIKKLIFEGYFLAQIDFTQKADTLYSISKSKKYLRRLKNDMVKISLYQHFLRLRDEDKKIKNIFHKEKEKINYKYFIELFEEKWS